MQLALRGRENTSMPVTHDSFQKAVDSLDSLCDRLRAAPADFAAARQRGALLEITGDLVAFSDVLLDVHDAAVAFEAKQEDGLLDPELLPRPMRVVRRLHATYRSFFFLSRELQDHAFGALLLTCPGCSLPPYPSMNAAANPRNPVRVLLDETAPDYRPPCDCHAPRPGPSGMQRGFQFVTRPGRPRGRAVLQRH